MTPELKTMILFQNLKPGTPDSSLVKDFKEECIDKEEKEDTVEQQREQLLNNFPPILAFRGQKQEKDFYKRKAEEMCDFCCAGVADVGGELSLQDNYKLSIGTGTLYEGSADSIREQVQQDIRKEPFGSLKQEQGLESLKEFNNLVKQVEQQGLTSASTQERNTSIPNPFEIIPKPEKD
ncbi:Uncharacterised protein [Legionella beliardensis]|uniref:Uncharacterized protein n=1 Tax=Legionella beliardensis TaxID=91822 RepID=A0A378I5M8_9GAMM|nr:hypothetical protein [Legionella beliardensis]STX29961.1 Uncharacterised protein [Legionella beliardensis]